jgi:hypothetical protein
VDDIGCLAIFVVRCEKNSDVEALSHSREAGIQLTMSEDWMSQVEDHFIQREPLAAVECSSVS